MDRYITCSQEPVLERAVREFPVAALIGPRQSGKTTSLRHLFEADFQDSVNTYHGKSGDIIPNSTSELSIRLCQVQRPVQFALHWWRPPRLSPNCVAVPSRVAC